MHSSGRLSSYLAICFLLALALAACGGGGSSVTETTPSPPTAKITSVAVSCASATVPVSHTSQCAAAVQGTGNFNSSVTWSVSTVQGGNATVGTIDAGGLYTAPNSVPTPYTVTVAAMSTADTTKSATASIIVAGTIASVSQTIVAADGGTIILPDGSSVTIPAGVLSADQTVTLSELSALPQEPPNKVVVGVGPVLDLKLSIPNSALLTSKPHFRGNTSQPHQAGNSGVQFSIVMGLNAVQGLHGSAPMSTIATASGQTTFLFPSGSFDSQTNIGSVNVDPSYLSGMQEMAATMANFNSTLPLAQLSWEVSWDGQAFQPIPSWTAPACPLPGGLQTNDATVLVLVHGMTSSVEDSFSKSASKIKAAAGYDLLLGFDYDWTQRLQESGAELATFIDSLANCPGIQKIDIEAHSEGVAVTLSAGGQITNPQAIRLLTNVVALAGPIKGTPMADYPGEMLACYINHQTLPNLLPAMPAPLNQGLAWALSAPLPVLQDLTSRGDPLAPARKSFSTNLPNVRLTVIGGEASYCGPSLDAQFEQSIFDGHPFDGVIPLDSALGYDSGIPLHPFRPFSGDSHDLLIDDQTVIDDVGSQVNPSAILPALTCEASTANCEGEQNTSFTFQGTGFSASKSNIEVLSQSSSGVVTTLGASSLQDNSGSISWSVTPSCSDPTGSFSIFSVDTEKTLASDNVMQTIDAGDCGPANPVPSISSLFPGSLPIGSAAQNLRINGSGFLANSSVTFNGSPRTPVYVSPNELTISLTSADLETAGSFPVIVTNPLPGGGSSNSVVFTVTTGSLGTVTINPASVSVPTNGVQTFAATVSGGGALNWSVQEGAPGGTITGAGIYTAPGTPGTYHIVAANASNSSQSAISVVTVVAGPSLSTVHSFNHSTEGANPWAPLLQGSDGNFYGTTNEGGDLSCWGSTPNSGCGTVFVMDDSGKTSTLHSFTGSPDGAFPVAGLLQADDNSLYGTTLYGGANLNSCDLTDTSTPFGCGTIFKIGPSGTLTTLYSFSSFSALEGVGPEAALIQATDHKLYGNTVVGGGTACQGFLGSTTATGCGSIFNLDTSGSLSALHPFTGPEGAYPASALIQATDSNFYGVTGGGGSQACNSYATPGCGVVFKMTSDGVVTPLHAFAVQDGAFPNGALVQAADGDLYGTTVFGGSLSCTGGAQWQGCGVIFKIDLAGNLTVLHSFSGPDGAYPNAALLQASDGNFYGTTQGGGDSACTGRYGPGCGTVFKMDPAGNITVLYSFAGGTDGFWPEASLIQATDGNLYGTAVYGGANDDGVVFTLSNVNSLDAKARTQGPEIAKPQPRSTAAVKLIRHQHVAPNVPQLPSGMSR